MKRDARESDRSATAVSADAHSAAKSNRGVSDPTSGTPTLAQGRSRGRSRPGCVSEIVRWFAHANVANNRVRIRPQTQVTIRRAIRGDSRSIVRCNHAVKSWSIWRHISPLVALRSLPHRVVDFHAVLGGVNALRLRSDRAFRTACGR